MTESDIGKDETKIENAQSRLPITQSASSASTTKMPATIMNDVAVNPFVHKLHLNTYDTIKVALMTVTILPIRVVIAFVCLVLAWSFACIGIHGFTTEELRTKPLTGWRRDLLALTAKMMRILFVFGGFHWISVKGRRASVKEAPILAVAPHSTYFDALPLVYMGAPSIVAKTDAEEIPFFGKLINFTQPVYVSREDPNSRHTTITEITKRANSNAAWPQVMIFPEGTCTNRSCLITFKPGAFYPGVPVQPVCIKYPNRLDTITWTWEGPSALKQLWLTFSQFHNYCEIEYLPVYIPSDEEAKDHKLFARNVRQKMAEALGVPVADYSYDDCRLMSKAAQNNLPYESGLVEVQKLRAKLGLDQRNVEEELSRYAEIAKGKDGVITIYNFAEYLGLPVTDSTLKEIFDLYDQNGNGRIDFRQYLIGLFAYSKPANTEETIQLAFKLFDRHGRGHITKEDLTEILKKSFNMTPQETERVFNQVDIQGKGYITYEEFRFHAQRKPEYAKIFTTYRKRMHLSIVDQKFKSTEGVSQTTVSRSVTSDEPTLKAKTE